MSSSTPTVPITRPPTHPAGAQFALRARDVAARLRAMTDVPRSVRQALEALEMAVERAVQP